jgi:lipoprotein LprG
VSRFRVPRPLVFATVALVLAASLGCSSKKPAGGNLPAATQVLADSAAKVREVKTVRFAIETSGTVSGIPLRKAGGQLTREGDAQGTVQLDQGGTASELQFVIVGDTAYIKGATGGWQSVPASMASTVYDPAAILDPARGLAKLMETTRDARTEAREEVAGTEAYRIAAAFDPQVVGALVPGAGAGVTGQLWIGVANKLPLRVRFSLPGAGGGDAATVTVTFTEYDRPVSISAPS